jgi:RNA polymerase sigma-70 factor (ECF subfamily)
VADIRSKRDDLYNQALDGCGNALDRLARAYEPDPDKRRDLLQEIHVALWLSFEKFEGRCSLRTWVFRVAHNTATSVVIRRKALAPSFVGIDEAEDSLQRSDSQSMDQQEAMESLWALIQKLKPPDKQIILLYLEGVDAASIGEITGFSAGNVATKIHRIKHLLSRRFHEGERRAE